MKLLFCTTNELKFDIAKISCKQHRIDVEQIIIDLPEIQSEDPVAIIKQKALDAFAQIQKPVLVRDDSWSIPALNGFPGPYMKAMNHWFDGQDWINIMSKYKDRRIYLESRLAFVDRAGLITIFEDTYERKFLTKPSDKPGVSILRSISLPDSENPNNELLAKDLSKNYAERELWDKFLEWYTDYSS